MSQWSSQVSIDALVQTASELIAVPSVSGDELNVMRLVMEWCDARGLRYEVVSRDASRPNVIVRVGDASLGPIVAMNGHLDTVPVSDPDKWRTGPYEPTVSDDGTRLFGRGASDMKSSVGVMLNMMAIFKDAPLQGQLEAHIVSDEETSGYYGTVFLIEEMEAGRIAKTKYCLIGEKSDLKVRNAERGIFNFDVVFHGRASHTASARATGINAIAKAAKGILALEQDLDSFHPAIGKPVISVNQIHAGVASNVVPGECTIRVDRRLIPGETQQSVVDEVRAQFAEIAAADPDFRFTLVEDPETNYIPANITESDSILVTTLQQAVRDVTGNEPEYFVAWAGATDGRFYRLAGIETVGFGPGGEAAHGANEAVFIRDLELQGQVYAETIAALLGVRE